ncbi:MAG: methyltransferase domain-containing protein [Acidobacteria bacterium]|nr:methyltransferase domain-containing protein [Acidobacteriota bacterium]
MDYSERMDEAAYRMGSFYRKCLRGRSFKRVLEVGCSGGGVLLTIAGDKKFGVDIDLDGIKLLKRRGGYGVVGDGERGLPFRDSYFDLVIATDFFEHLVHPEIAILEIKRVLKPEGYLLTHVPNEFHWRNLLKLLKNESFITTNWFSGSSEHNYPHLRFFSLKGFRRFIEDYGFDIIEDWTYRRGGMLARLTRHQLFTLGPTYLCQPRDK